MGNSSADGGGGARDPRAALTATLKRIRPAAIKAVLEGGAEQAIAIPQRRERWSAVARALEGIAWVKVLCLDAKGGLMETIVGEDADDGADDVPTLGNVPKGLDREHGLALIIIRAQEASTKAQRDAMNVLVDGFRAQNEMLAARLASLEAIQDRTLKLAHEAAVQLAPTPKAEQAPEDELMMTVVRKAFGGGDEKVIEAKLEKVMERVARKVMTGGATPPTTNGHANGAATKETA